jgi:hypothetical protein
MRILPLVALLLVAGCSSEKKHSKIRFLFDVEATLVNEVSISIGGKKVTIDPPVANVRTTSGFVDFDAGEIKSDAQPEIRLGNSVCGESLLTAAEMERKPPNESNVVVITVTERLIPKPFTVAIDPDAKNVKLGSYEVPASHSDLMTFYGTCAFTISVDGQTIEMPARSPTDHSLLVAASPSACLTEGVVVYATPGAQCEREWAEQRTGRLAYWARIAPSYAFKAVPETQGTYQKNACIARGFFGRC